MVQINFAQKTVNVKVVFYGPGMSGKTTNLEVVHQRAPEPNKGELTSISTDGDRTLFFDYMPLELGTVAGMRTCFQLYTVPGQVYYNSTRKLVLQGVDGVIFVADSSAAMLNQNLDSLRNLEENLNEYGKSLATLPFVLQFNKRDLPDAMSVEELERLLNPHKVPTFEAIANTGQGVFPTIKALAATVLKTIMDESQNKSASYGGKPSVGAPAPAPAAPVAPPAAAAPQLTTQPQPAAPVPQAQAPQVAPPAPQPVYGGPPAGTPAAPALGMQAPAPQARPQARPAQQRQAPARQGAGQMMQTPNQARPRTAQQRSGAKKGAPAKATRATRPAPAPEKSGKSGLMTGIFVVVGAGLGAALAWFVMTKL